MPPGSNAFLPFRPSIKSFKVYSDTFFSACRLRSWSWQRCSVRCQRTNVAGKRLMLIDEIDRCDHAHCESSLFGDTVNTASSMESHDEAHKIHITKELNDALAKVGGFKTEPRGPIDVKGKGMMNTYWLTCKDGRLKIREELSWFADMEPVFLENLKMLPSTTRNSKKK